MYKILTMVLQLILGFIAGYLAVEGIACITVACTGEWIFIFHAIKNIVCANICAIYTTTITKEKNQ